MTEGEDFLQQYLALVSENTAYLDVANDLVQSTIEDSKQIADFSEEAVQKAQQELEEEKLRTSAAVTIQCMMRSRLAWRVFVRRRGEKAEEHRAASRIQALYRAHSAQRLLAEMRARHAEEMMREKEREIEAMRAKLAEAMRAKQAEAPHLKTVHLSHTPDPASIKPVTGLLLAPVDRQPRRPPVPTTPPEIDPEATMHVTSTAALGPVSPASSSPGLPPPTALPAPFVVDHDVRVPKPEPRPPKPSQLIAVDSSVIQEENSQSLNLKRREELCSPTAMRVERQEYLVDEARFLMEKAPAPPPAAEPLPRPAIVVPPPAPTSEPDPTEEIVAAFMTMCSLKRAAVGRAREAHAALKPLAPAPIPAPPVPETPEPLALEDNDDHGVVGPIPVELRQLVGAQRSRLLAGVTSVDLSYRSAVLETRDRLAALLPNLQELVLQKPTALPPRGIGHLLRGHERLRTLICESFELLEMPDLVLPSLEVAVLSQLGLAVAPALSSPGLRLLSLHGNQLTAPPLLPTRLTQLDLSSNQLPTVGRALDQCRFLVRLDLSDNCLTSMPDLGNLPNLTHLYISGNALTSLYTPTAMLPLRVLWASRNRLQGLDEGWGASFPCLESLQLDENSIAQIAVSRPMPCLTSLQLAFNQIADHASLVAIATTAPRLKTLGISNNPAVEVGRRASYRVLLARLPLLTELNNEDVPRTAMPENPTPVTYLRAVAVRVPPGHTSHTIPVALHRRDGPGFPDVDGDAVLRRRLHRHSPLDLLARRAGCMHGARAAYRSLPPPAATPSSVARAAVSDRRILQDAAARSVSRSDGPERQVRVDHAVVGVPLVAGPRVVTAEFDRINDGMFKIRKSGALIHRWWRHRKDTASILLHLSVVAQAFRFRHHHSARVIQRAARARIAFLAQQRAALEQKLREEDAVRHRMAEAAVTIQCMYRVVRAKQMVKAARAHKKRMEEARRKREAEEKARAAEQAAKAAREAREREAALAEQMAQRMAAKTMDGSANSTPRTARTLAPAPQSRRGSATPGKSPLAATASVKPLFEPPAAEVGDLDADLDWVNDLSEPSDLEDALTASVSTISITQPPAPAPEPEKPKRSSSARAQRSLLPGLSMSAGTPTSDSLSLQVSREQSRTERVAMQWAQEASDETDELARAFIRNRRKYTKIRRTEAKRKWIEDPLARLQNFRQKAGIAESNPSTWRSHNSSAVTSPTPGSASTMYPKPPIRPKVALGTKVMGLDR
ncbi:Leucine Rich repeats (2 copies) [Carpediemonas membranifera]|uniref:Leucine Rich repeats (2 copies) n=1 Tax=Carpediemonas membranifera TaxID=201153 RepID=A0A8J6AW37_9EUKA|nr:Leucine Rich repeats (2 copies) [Carpediemonas membranifera]|eukprot:KAG9395638.1 Leucine Rich repeats (2 copies) [Carpediemonas membranifera]